MPTPEQPAPKPSGSEQIPNLPTPEKAAPTPERAGGGEAASQGAAKLPPVATPQAPATPAPTPPPANDQGVVLDDTPPVAQDQDVIEKEWVNKAKQIVNETKEDPYLQNQKTSALKADYLKKRYNKTIKLSDDQ